MVARTTRDGGGYPHGVATGMGPSPEDALEALKQAAHRQANEIAAPHRVPPPTRDLSFLSASARRRAERRTAATEAVLPERPQIWLFEVVDVRLVSGQMGERRGWVAYGTLLSKTGSPRTDPDR